MRVVEVNIQLGISWARWRVSRYLFVCSVLKLCLLNSCVLAWTSPAMAFDAESPPTSFERMSEIVDRYAAATLSAVRSQWQIVKIASGTLIENVFRLRAVSILGLRHVTADELEQLLVGREGIWFWDYHGEELRERLLAHPWVQSAKFSVGIYPPRLVVEVIEEQPYLVAEFVRGSWLIGRSGKLITPLKDIRKPELIVQSVELPRLSGEISRVSGEPDRELVRKSAAILRLYESAGGFAHPLERAERGKDGSLRVYMTAVDEPMIVLGETDFAGARRALEQLRLAKQDMQSRGELAKTFDLRFQGQVVVTPIEAQAGPPKSNTAKINATKAVKANQQAD